jgi:tetratricopeptide (TPR) repeat protein
MDENEYEALVHQGVDAAEADDISTSINYLNQAAKYRKSPVVQSYRAFCLAKGQGQVRSAAIICQESIKQDRNNSSHYLILGRILLMSGDRSKAIKTFRLGLKASPNPLIIKELKGLGLRKPIVVSRLKRSNPINLILGKILSTIGLR